MEPDPKSGDSRPGIESEGPEGHKSEGKSIGPSVLDPLEELFRKQGIGGIGSAQPGAFTSLFGASPKPSEAPIPPQSGSKPASDPAQQAKTDEPEQRTPVVIPAQERRSADSTGAEAVTTVLHIDSIKTSARTPSGAALAPASSIASKASSAEVSTVEMPKADSRIPSDPTGQPVPPCVEKPVATPPVVTPGRQDRGLQHAEFHPEEKSAPADSVPLAHVPPAPVAPPPPKSAPGAFTAMFGAPSQQPAGEAAALPVEKPSPVKEVGAAAPVPGAPASPAPAEKGEFTQLFSGLNAGAHSVPAAPEPDAAGVPKQAAAQGEFTRMFGKSPTSAPPSSVPAQSGPSDEFVKMFNFPLRDSAPTEPPAQKVPGEFTGLFSAPSAPPQPPKSEGGQPGGAPSWDRAGLFGPPSAQAGSSEPSREPGAFTKLFSSGVSSEPKSGPPPAEPFAAQKSQEPGGFTKLFGGIPVAPVDPLGQPAPAKPEPKAFQWQQPTPEAPPSPQERQQMRSPAPPSPSGQPPSGATQIFARPSVAQAAPPPLPAGPSAFTKVIFGNAQQQPEVARPPVPSTPGAPVVQTPYVQAPQVQAPYVQAPQVQAPYVQAPQVQAPQVQAPYVQPPQIQGPQVQTPYVQSPQVQMPYMSAPQVQMPQAQMSSPAAPQPAGPSEKRTPWALIIILNVLFILAVLLVLYFALKH